MKSLSRGKGDSATAAAAYRAGLALDDPTGARHDYSKKAGVLAVDMLAPDGAPAWALDPHKVWARVEEHETRKNARVAREVLIALPHELDPAQRRDLARDVGQLLVDRYGVAAQVALHAPDKGGDGRNYHAHILITPRQVGPAGFGDSAAKVLDEYKAGAQELKDLRAAIGARMNTALISAGVAARVDARSLRAQQAAAAKRGDFQAVAALDRPATRHEGKAVTQARRRGERLPRARRNDRVTNAGARRFNAHTRRFEALKQQAASEGRLQPVDEQALHARALVERQASQAQRLRLEATKELDALDQMGQRRAAVQARAPRSAPHKAGSSMPRPAPAGSGQQAKGAGAIERAIRTTNTRAINAREGETMAASQAARNLDELIQELLKRARLALQESGMTPLQRASARALLASHEDMSQKRQAYEAAKEARQQARLDRRFAQATANMTTEPTDWRSRALRSVGLPTTKDRKAQAAQDQKQQAKTQEQEVRQARDNAREARNQAVVAFDRAREEFMRQFTRDFPPSTPKADNMPAPPKAKLTAPYIKTPDFEPPAPRGHGPAPR